MGDGQGPKERSKGMCEGREHDGMVEHSDRMSWYCALMEEWTGETPQFLVVGREVVVWIDASGLPGGVTRLSMQAWASTLEQAVEDLTNAVYQALHEAHQPVVWGEVVLAQGG